MSNPIEEKVILCPNCANEAEAPHAEDCCILSIFAQILLDGGTEPEDITKLIEQCNVDKLWDDLSPLIVSFEKGEYSYSSDEVDEN